MDRKPAAAVVATTSTSTTSTTTTGGGGSEEKSRSTNVPAAAWFPSNTDLIREIATYLVDDAETILKLGCVSKSCHTAVVIESPQIWKATCRYRWKSKWGFVQRWKTALQQEQGLHGAVDADGRWWRQKYQWQEQDAKRTAITAAELHSLTFDFRFWLSQFWGQGNLLASGLKWTASQNFQFAARRSFPINPEFSWPGMERGQLSGHPSGRDDLEWFLDQDGLGMQWGKLPDLWPRGTIHRLATWGWEIRNPNVCLRAMDTKEVIHDGTGDRAMTLVKNDDLLWKDYLDKLRRYPTDFGLPQEGIAFMEAPLEFWEFYQNRQRFPRLGIDDDFVEESPLE